MWKNTILILGILLLLTIPVSASTNISSLETRVLPISVIGNASPHLVSGVSSLSFDGSKTNQIVTTIYIFTSSTPNDINLKLYYDNNSVNGRVASSGDINIPGVPAFRAINLTIGSDTTEYTSGISGNGFEVARINYGKSKITGQLGIDITDIWGDDVATKEELNLFGSVFCTMEPSVCLFQQGVSTVIFNLLVESNAAVFYPENTIINNPIYKFELSGTSNFKVIFWTTDKNKFISEAHTAGPDLTNSDIIELLTYFLTTLTSITSTIFMFEVILVTNAPWLFVGIEVLGSMLVVWNANGNIWRIIKEWWRLQEKIVDFFMYIPSFIEKHWILTSIVGIVTITGYSASNIGALVAALSGHPWSWI
jgi:hypothetical protein